MNNLASNNSVRVRIAPSPTGIPHIGNTRTALFNYLFARHNNGKFIVRIEDTDQKRIVKGAEETIYEILEWLSLKPDETYLQSERLDVYRKHAKILLDKKLAYEKDGAIWMKIPEGHDPFSWNDSIGQKDISFKSEVIEDFVILKSDGFPTYHLANVVDDHLMKISHVIRGDEWISSTPKHLLLYEAFGWKHPIFAHLPVILGPDKTKLSKRHGAKSVLDYKNEGFLKEALLNFMALLGWAPKEDKEILSTSEMIKLFDLKDVNTNSPIFNIDKLLWFNGYYIRQLSVNGLKSILRQAQDKSQKSIPDSIGDKIQNLSDDMLDKLIELAKTRMRTLNDFKVLVSHFFEEPKIRLDQKEQVVAKQLVEQLSAIKQFNNLTILAKLKHIMAEKSVRMPVLYKILTGQESGLPLPESLEILGKEKTIDRLKKLIRT